MSRLYPGWGSGKNPFETTLQANSLACMGRDDMEGGDKVILPQTAFKQVSRLRLPFPLTFEVTNPRRKKKVPGPGINTGKNSTNKRRPPEKNISKRPPNRGRKTVESTEQKTEKDVKGKQMCGVMEFSAPEGQVFLPFWMMQNLRLKEGSKVFLKTVESKSIPKGTFCRLQPHTSDFLDLAATMNLRDLLETAFRNYSVLHTGETILVAVADKKYYINVLETKPELNISLYGSLDLEVDFAAPLDTTLGKIRPESQDKKQRKLKTDIGEEERLDSQITNDKEKETHKEIHTPNQNPSPKAEDVGKEMATEHSWGVGQKLSTGEKLGTESNENLEKINEGKTKETTKSISEIQSSYETVPKAVRTPKIKKFARKTDVAFNGSGNCLNEKFSSLSIENQNNETLVTSKSVGRQLHEPKNGEAVEAKPSAQELRQRRLRFFNAASVKNKQLKDESTIAVGSSLSAIRKQSSEKRPT